MPGAEGSGIEEGRVENRWSDDEATRTVVRYRESEVPEDLALRVYTTRLLGSDPRLVLHGGGNTSVKSRATDITGEELEVLYVKGSGWDMATIEPAGLPAVQLRPLLRLVELDRLSDEDMVNLQRRNLLDSTAPNPSVETLLHAWVPHRFIDHTHANAILALTDQPDGDAVCREVFGERAAIVPYIMPGFDLAKACNDIVAASPGVEGMILLKHGVFTFGETARQAYDRMIEFVSIAEDTIRDRATRALVPADLPPAPPAVSDIAPIVRGLLANPGVSDDTQRFILDVRDTAAVLEYVGARELDRFSQVGTVTPDHAIRTKPKPVLLPPPSSDALDAWRVAAAAAVAAYRTEYMDYFERHDARLGGTRKMLDTSPRVVLVPGVGILAAGATAKAAGAAGDLAEATVEVISAAEAMSRFESIDEADSFDIEYWSLEQAKLAGAREPPLARHVVAVTGGAGTIGRATAAAFHSCGAEVALLDLPGERLGEAATEIGALGIECDVTNDVSVRSAFAGIARAFGGLDILVSNAGAAWQGEMAGVDDRVLRESFELNFFAHQRVAAEAVRIFRLQGTGGCLLFNVSKQAVDPGRGFGPYGLPKAAAMALVRQYALEHGREGIRSNGINADRIRSGILTGEMVRDRAEARRVSEAEYLSGNLLGREVEPVHVADAFVALALARRTTGALLTVDGGNLAAALR